MGTNSVNTFDFSNIDECMNKITENGGKITVPKMAIPGVGWISYFKDFKGNVFGIMQSDQTAQ